MGQKEKNILFYSVGQKYPETQHNDFCLIVLHETERWNAKLLVFFYSFFTVSKVWSTFSSQSEIHTLIFLVNKKKVKNLPKTYSENCFMIVKHEKE